MRMIIRLFIFILLPANVSLNGMVLYSTFLSFIVALFICLL